MRSVLVTGAAGFIGMHVSERLLKMGHKVIGIDNLNSYYDVSLKEKRLDLLCAEPEFKFYKLDIADKNDYFDVVEKYKPEKVIHLAAQAGVRYSLENPEAYISANISGFLNILEACRSFGTEHLLYASSSSVYGGNTKLPFSVEDRVDTPVSLYAATKKSNELMAYCYSHLYNIKSTGLRFFTVYGPWGRPDMALFMFTKAITEGKPIQVFNHGEMWRDFTYVDDIVTGIIQLMEKSRALKLTPPHYVYNIGNHTPVKLTEFIEYIELAVGKKAVKEFLPMQAGDVPKTFADVADLMADTDFSPNTLLKEGVGRFVEWYKKYE
ncbi:MAG: NAD-dependent epimerase [Oscillospiraceae bacterium]|nr:NAD-dependent epimerase [Oscillospiraceae bacterium]